MKLKYMWIPLLALVTISACGDNNPVGGNNGPARGTYRAAVTGAQQLTMEGAAYSLEGPYFNIALFQIDREAQRLLGISTFRINAGAITPGTYPIADISNGRNDGSGNAIGFVFTSADASTFQAFASTRGTLKITSANGPYIQGTLSFDAVEQLEVNGRTTSGPRTIHVEAEFHTAKCRETTFPAAGCPTS